MVCSKCEKKIKELVIPDKWKDGTFFSSQKTLWADCSCSE